MPISRLKAMTLKARGLGLSEIIARTGCSADELLAALSPGGAIAPSRPPPLIIEPDSPAAVPVYRPAPVRASAPPATPPRPMRRRAPPAVAEDEPPPRGPREIEKLRPLNARSARYVQQFLTADWSPAWTAYLFDARLSEVVSVGRAG